MGWPDSEGRCRWHPNHRQSKGVCPSCLRERLSQLCSSSSANNSSYLPSPGSSYNSVSSSTHSSFSTSPSTDRRRPRRDAGAKIALLTRQRGEDPLQGSKPEPLTKSRSLAFVVPNPLGWARKDKDKKVKMEEQEKKKNKVADDDGKVEKGKEEKKNKKRGFWSKLAVGDKKRKEKDGLFHSKTVRETSSARWTFLPGPRNR